MLVQFALRLLCGMSWMWCLMPRRQVTSGYFRIQMLVALGLGVLAALAVETLPGEMSAGRTWLTADQAFWVSAGLAAAAFCGSALWTLEWRAAGSATAWLVAALATALLLGTNPAVAQRQGPLRWHVVASELSAAVLLGSAVAAMLLGHWYLTVPTMSIAPLSRMNGYFGGAALLRLISAGGGLAQAAPYIAGGTQWTWLALRWLAGLIGPLVLAVMVVRILKYRNTQSATGVLFVGVILTFIGELTAALLTRELAVPM